MVTSKYENVLYVSSTRNVDWYNGITQNLGKKKPRDSNILCIKFQMHTLFIFFLVISDSVHLTYT